MSPTKWHQEAVRAWCAERGFSTDHVSFILDHIGKPDIKGGLLDPWRAELRELSRLENVWCKLSGLVTEADHTGWTPDGQTMREAAPAHVAA